MTEEEDIRRRYGGRNRPTRRQFRPYSAPSVTVIIVPPSAPEVPETVDYFYHLWNGAVPTFDELVVAIAKGMVPIINISNASYSWGANYEAAALAWQAANGNPKIVLSQAFWSQFASLADAWPSSATVWNNTYPARRLTDTGIRTMLMDFEPPHYYPEGEHDIPNCLVEQRFGVVSEGIYGVAGTAQQVSDARSFLASHNWQLGTPEIRNLSTRVPTVVGSHYNILQGRCTRLINQATYDPFYTDLAGISDEDIVGIRVSPDGHSGTYSPEDAAAAFPDRDKMYFPVVSSATAALTGDAYWVALKADMLDIANRL